MNIDTTSDHIILWKDNNGWHSENYGNNNLLPIHGDFSDAIAEGQATANEPCFENTEVWLVKVEFVHKFQPKR